ncbi:MAG: hypothetical protein ACI3ZL_05855 [Candidatus Cryptobacteroides sp.]
MEEENKSNWGCLIFLCIVAGIVQCIFVYPKMRHDFKGYYIEGDNLFTSIGWTASLWFGYFVAAAIVAVLLYLLVKFIINKLKK